jgi:hypothetical protein
MYEFFPLDKLYTDLPAQAIACSLSEVLKKTNIRVLIIIIIFISV